MNPPGGRTASQPRAASTRRKIIRMTATASTVFSTTRSRAETTAPAKPTSTGSPRSAAASSTSASRRECRSPASTEGCWITGPSGAPRCRAHFMPAARRDSSFCSAPIRRSAGRWDWDRSSSIRAAEMLDLVVIDGQARGIVARNLVNGSMETYVGRCGRAGNRRLCERLLSSPPMPNVQCDGNLEGPQARSVFRQSLFHADPPDLYPGLGRSIQSKLTLMSESPPERRPHLGPEEARGYAAPGQKSRKNERDYYLERLYPSFGNLVPRDVASRRAKEMCDKGFGVGNNGNGRLPRFCGRDQAASGRKDRRKVREPVRNVPRKSRRRIRTRRRCGFILPSITPWAGSGWTII